MLCVSDSIATSLCLTLPKYLFMSLKGVCGSSVVFVFGREGEILECSLQISQLQIEICL